MLVPALEGHRLWAPLYDLGANPLLALERRAMWNVLEPLQAKKVIDVACGTGQWLLHLQQAGSDVFGCDLCQEMLDEAQKIFSLRGRLARADAECIPFRTSMADLVLCSVSLGYFHDLDRVWESSVMNCDIIAVRFMKSLPLLAARASSPNSTGMYTSALLRRRFFSAPASKSYSAVC